MRICSVGILNCRCFLIGLGYAWCEAVGMMAQVSSSFRDGFPISESLGHGAWDLRLRDLLLVGTWNDSKFIERYSPILFRSPV